MSLRNVHQRLCQLQKALVGQEASALLDGPTINGLRLRYARTGELPANALQRTSILYMEAAHNAMLSTCPDSDDSGAQYRECRQTLAEAAIAHNAERDRWGLPPVPAALP